MSAWLEMSALAGNVFIGWKWLNKNRLKLAEKGRKWLVMAGSCWNGQELLERAGNGWSGWKWHEVT